MSSTKVVRYDGIKDGWFVERSTNWPGSRMSFEVEKVLVDEISEYQHILIFKSKHYGNILVLDGIIQVTEEHEFTYHEMIVHPSMFAHINPKKKKF